MNSYYNYSENKIIIYKNLIFFVQFLQYQSVSSEGVFSASMSVQDL